MKRNDWACRLFGAPGYLFSGLPRDTSSNTESTPAVHQMGKKAEVMRRLSVHEITSKYPQRAMSQRFEQAFVYLQTRINAIEVSGNRN